ncbi:LysR family transcriptional regulator [Aquabacterium sp.]|uniref:LysR family transcriptional regulator n=1 Tax=Aquabacterium sp. TaxID=1872578 RepID=UPI0025C39B08|nr:LysR family transcriptional regulator [Aquabacterium sp.]
MSRSLATLPSPASVQTLPDLKLLHLFELLCSTRSVTRAAEQLGQSQPTVSIWLGKLRQQFDDPLFVRTPQGMQPTPRADALRPLVQDALTALHRVSAQVPRFDPATASRLFRICMTDGSHVTLLPDLLRRVRTQAPGVQLEAALIGPDTARALESGEADLALGYVPGLDSGFYQQTLYDESWLCLAHPQHPRIGKRLTLKAYQAEGHVALLTETGRHLLTTALKAQGVTRQVVLSIPGFLGLGAIVSNTDLLATLPRHIGEKLALTHGLAVHACPMTLPGFQVKQHWHARYHQDPGHQWLRGLCAELFTDVTGPRQAPGAGGG